MDRQPEHRERRAGRAVVEGRRRARFLAERLGVALREERRAAGLSQAELGSRCLLSQARVSQLERGGGTTLPLEAWCLVAAVLGRQLAAFLERSSGASLPRDVQHLRGQELLIREGASGGWQALPEERVVVDAGAHRFIDVALIRREHHEACVAELWDLLPDVGEAMRGFEVKLAATEQHTVGNGAPGSWRTSGIWVVRATQRNRDLVRQLSALFAAKFAGSADAWIAALHDAARPMPAQPGILWVDLRATRLIARRRRTHGEKEAASTRGTNQAIGDEGVGPRGSRRARVWVRP